MQGGEGLGWWWMRRGGATREEHEARLGKIGPEWRWKSGKLWHKAVMGGVNDAGRARHTGC